jgi:hypothetical protein
VRDYFVVGVGNLSHTRATIRESFEAEFLVVGASPTLAAYLAQIIADFISALIFVCLLRIDEAKANIKLIYECRCNERL